MVQIKALLKDDLDLGELDVAALDGRCRAKREHHIFFPRISPEKWLKSWPESGLDCLICADLGELDVAALDGLAEELLRVCQLPPHALPPTIFHRKSTDSRDISHQVN